MPTIEALLLVSLAGFALSASPGPSMLYVLSRSLGQDRKAGLVSSAGLAVGGMVHAVAAAAGLSAILAYSEALYRVIAILGAGYLVYLGIEMYRSRNERIGGPNEVRPQSLRRIFGQGVLVEVLNPKTALFFLAFLPQFVSHSESGIVLQMLVLGALVPLTAIPSDVAIAFAGGTIARGVAARPTLACTLNCLGAVFLIALGARLFVTGL